MMKNEVEKEIFELQIQFTELMRLFDDKEINLDVISVKYSKLKQQVNGRVNDLEKARKDNRLNEYEGYFLLPCMKKISLSCNARVGSKDKSALSSSIYDGEDYCSYWLTEIRNS